MVSVLYFLFLLFLKALPGAGHHVYADKPQMFNQWVNEVCTMADTNEQPSIKSTNDTSTPINQQEAKENEEVPLDEKPLPVTEDVH